MNNAGLFKKSAGSGTSTVSWDFNNTGTLEVDSGALSFSGAFNNSGTANVGAGALNLVGNGTSSGAFNVSPGAAINFSSGTHTLLGATLSSSGAINFNGATVNVSGGVAFDGDGAGDVQQRRDWRIRDNGVQQSGVDGREHQYILQLGNPQRGQPGHHGQRPRVLRCRLLGDARQQRRCHPERHGGHVCASIGSYDWGQAVIYNASGGVFDIQSDAGFSPGNAATGTVNNAGLFKKSAGSGTSTVSWDFNNTGTLEVDSGALSFSGAFNNSGTANVRGGALNLVGNGTSSGAFNVSPGAAINFSSGTHTLVGATLSSSGAINFNGATVNVSGGVPSTVTGPATFSNGTIGGSGTMAFNNLAWTGGNINTFCNLAIPSGGNLAITANGQGFYVVAYSAMLANSGVATLSGTGGMTAPALALTIGARR